jgi:hypothetical protein
MGIDRGISQAMAEHKDKIKGPHFIFSAENPKYPEKNELKLTHEQVLHHLKGAGYDAHEVHGHYGAPERSIAVYGTNPKHAEELHHLASKLGQDSSIHSTGQKHEMRFHHGADAGKKVHGEGTQWHDKKPKDFFTSLPGGQHHFTHNFNFEKSEPIKKSLEENELGGLIPDKSEKERAKKADLITLPEDVKGTNCSNCKFVKILDKEKGLGYCEHPEVDQHVTARMCCALWDNKKAERDFNKSESISKSEDPSGRMKLTHYSNKEGLTNIEPKFKGKGVDARTKGRDTEHPHSFFYREGTPTESVVTDASSHKYNTSIDPKEHPLYDIGKDPQGFHQQVKEKNQGAFNMDMMHSKIKGAGFHGFYNSAHPKLPNVVAMYHPLKVESHEKLR